MPARKPSTKLGAVTAEYGRGGLPWRQALGTLMLVSVVGGTDGEVREMVDIAPSSSGWERSPSWEH